MQQYQIDFVNFVVTGAQQAHSDYGILASVTIAQAILESGWGKSRSAQDDFNLFGIKMPGAKPSNLVIVQGSYATDDGGYYRRYQSWGDSVIDHGMFLHSNSRYADLLTKNSYQEQTAGLEAAGYAGESGYATSLNELISENNLTQYDTGGSTTSNSSKGSDVVAIARKYLGVNYVYGGADPSGFDCSGLMQYCYAHVGVTIPRTTYEQVNAGTQISVDDLQLGDLLFFSNTGHVAMYSGNNMMIEAPHTGAQVREVAMRTPESCRRIVAPSTSGGGASDKPSIASTSYGIVPGSIKTSGVLYGRKYRVIVSNKDGVALDVSQLRCTFNIKKTMLIQSNQSEISIYNLSAQTENTIISEGSRVVVEAGYEGEQYGLIFDGNVVQCIRDKEDGVTYKLTLNSLDGDNFLNQSVANFSLLRGQNSRNIIENCASKATIPAELGSLSDLLGGTQLTRGKVIFGLAGDYIRQVAQSQNSSFYMEDGKINIIHANDLPSDEIVELSPTSGLISVPSQIEYGMSGKCLLNPRIKVNTLIHIDNSLVHDMQAQIGQVIRSLDNDGIYRVIEVVYQGDTRGNDWYCEFKTVTQAGVIPSMSNDGKTANPW